MAGWTTTPILRIFDVARAMELHLDFLGFAVDWEHRLEPDLPLYARVSRNCCLIHLSEHHGDATPGAAVRIQTDDLDGPHRELTARRAADPAAIPATARDHIQG